MTDATQQDAVRDAIIEERVTRHHALLTFCRELFSSNIIGTDVDDVQAFEVTGRPFPQQPGGGGVHVAFSVSWHMIGKTSGKCHNALETLLPDGERESDRTWLMAPPDRTLGEWYRGVG